MSRFFDSIMSWNLSCCCTTKNGVKVIAGVTLVCNLLSLMLVSVVLTLMHINVPNFPEEYPIKLILLEFASQVIDFILLLWLTVLSVYLFYAAKKENVKMLWTWLKLYVKITTFDTAVFIFSASVGLERLESIIFFIFILMIKIYCVLCVLKYKYELEDHIGNDGLQFQILSEDRTTDSLADLEVIRFEDWISLNPRQI